MTKAPAQRPAEARAEIVAALGELCPVLHRYCARLMGSIFDGEDVVQDAMVNALAAIDAGQSPQNLRPWLFKIAHNRAIDLLRSRTLRTVEPYEEQVDLTTPDPQDNLLKQEVLEAALARFLELPVPQRSAVILKDILDEPLKEIAQLLDLSTDAVKAHLARGRARLTNRQEQEAEAAMPRPFSPEILRYVTLFNAGDWDQLRRMLAEDVRLHQSLHSMRSGAKDVGMFFTIYARNPAVRVAPAWLEGHEVIAVFESGEAARPSHFMWLAWHAGFITFIRDYRYVPYVFDPTA